MEEQEKIMERVFTKKMPDLSISRLPKPTKQRFTELADQEFASDYGMTLKDCLEKRDIFLSFQEMFGFICTRLDVIEQAMQIARNEKPKIKFLGKKEEKNNEQIKPIDGQKQDM